MYQYQIGHGSYEDSSNHILFHQDKISKEELETIVASAYADCVIEQHEKYSKMKGVGVNDTDFVNSSYGDVDCEVVKYLVDHNGFKYPEIESSFYIWGWGSLLDEEFWEDGAEGNNKVGRKFSKALREEWIARFRRLPKYLDGPEKL